MGNKWTHGWREAHEESIGKERRRLRARICKRLRSPGIDSYKFGLRIYLGRETREEGREIGSDNEDGQERVNIGGDDRGFRKDGPG